MNHIMIAGRLGSDPEVRFTPSGTKVTGFRMATNYKKAGKEETIWWKITLWGESFDKMVSYLKKGSALFVTGELSKPELYNDREGNPQISLNVKANSLSFNPFGGKSSQEGGANQSSDANASNDSSYNYFESQATTGRQPNYIPGNESFTDDEVPF